MPSRYSALMIGLAPNVDCPLGADALGESGSRSRAERFGLSDRAFAASLRRNLLSGPVTRLTMTEKQSAEARKTASTLVRRAIDEEIKLICCFGKEVREAVANHLSIRLDCHRLVEASGLHIFTFAHPSGRNRVLRYGGKDGAVRQAFARTAALFESRLEALCRSG